MRLLNPTAVFVALCVNLFVASAYGSENDSEAILSGRRQVASAAELPNSITVPKPWMDEARRLSRLTKKTGLEHSACLDWDFKTDASGTFVPGENPWIVTGNTVGNKGSVRIHNDGYCSTKSVAQMHTHPGTSHLPSSTDVSNFYLHVRRASFVVGSKNMCVMIKTLASGYADGPNISVMYADYNISIFNSLLQKRDARTINGDYQVFMEIASSFVEKELSIGFYCGEIGSILSRVNLIDYRIPSDDPIYILYIKAIMISAKMEIGGEDLRFAFTPTLDEPFREFLSASDIVDSDDGDTIYSSKDYRKSFFIAYKIGEFEMTLNPAPAGFAAFGEDGGIPENYIQVFCGFAAHINGNICMINRDRLRKNGKTETMVLATYEFENGNWSLVDRRSSGWFKRSFANGKITEGACEYEGTLCEFK